MKWLLLVAGVVVGLVVVVVVAGSLLPRDHVASVSARIAATPAAVWTALTDPAAFPTWRGDVTRVEMLAPGPHGASWREYSRQGAITMEADDAEPPRRLVTRIADKNLPFGGYWEYRVEPDGEAAARVTITEHGSVYNPVFRFVSRFIMGHTATMKTVLAALGRKFGSEATPVERPGGARGS
jgi:uncharacterized protein YndB with AHSA1/START domain